MLLHGEGGEVDKKNPELLVLREYYMHPNGQIPVFVSLSIFVFHILDSYSLVEQSLSKAMLPLSVSNTYFLNAKVRLDEGFCDP